MFESGKTEFGKQYWNKLKENGSEILIKILEKIRKDEISIMKNKKSYSI